MSENREAFSTGTREPVNKSETMTADDYRRINRQIAEHEARKAASLAGQRNTALFGQRDSHDVTLLGTPTGGTVAEKLESLIAQVLNDDETLTRAEAVDRVITTEPGKSLWQQLKDSGITAMKADVKKSMAEDEIEALVKHEMFITHEPREKVVAKLSRDPRHREVFMRYRQAHYESATPQEPPDVRKRDARITIDRLVARERERSHVSKGEATRRVIETDPGRTAWAVLTGSAIHQPEPAPVETSDGIYEEFDRLAGDLRRANPKLTKAQAMLKASEANPALYSEYRRVLMQKAGLG